MKTIQDLTSLNAISINLTQIDQFWLWYRVHTLCNHTHTTILQLSDFVQDNLVSWYQKVHFAIFWIFWCKVKIKQADTPTIRMDCHPIQINWCSHLCHPHHFYAGCPSCNQLSIKQKHMKYNHWCSYKPTNDCKISGHSAFMVNQWQLTLDKILTRRLQKNVDLTPISTWMMGTRTCTTNLEPKFFLDTDQQITSIQLNWSQKEIINQPHYLHSTVQNIIS